MLFRSPSTWHEWWLTEQIGTSSNLCLQAMHSLNDRLKVVWFIVADCQNQTVLHSANHSQQIWLLMKMMIKVWDNNIRWLNKGRTIQNRATVPFHSLQIDLQEIWCKSFQMYQAFSSGGSPTTENDGCQRNNLFQKDSLVNTQPAQHPLLSKMESHHCSFYSKLHIC